MRIRLLLLAATLLAGCAHPWNAVNLPPGTSREQVIASAGQPQRVVPLANGGQRLQYTLQPLGRHAFMVDLDPAGRLVQARQVLTEANFHRIQVDRWTRDDVQREFGPPAQVDAVYSWPGPVWTYRWRDLGNADMFYFVYFDPQGVVRRAHPGIEHTNVPNDMRR
jgi:hypothetical protein